MVRAGELMLIEGEIKKLNGTIGIVTARFNHEITFKLEEAALTELKSKGVLESQIKKVRVAGAFEIPLAAQLLLESGCEGVIALGTVIRGDTDHYIYVCNAVERGCTELQLRYQKPVSFGVLTTENEDQALERAGGAHGNKGRDAAQVCLEMIDLIKKLKN